MKTESERNYEHYLGIMNQALDLFNKRKLKDARAAFNKLKNSGILEFQNKAEVYLEIIEEILSARRTKVEEEPLEKAIRLINEKEPEEALQVLDSVKDEDAKIWYLRALALTMLDRTDEAAEALKKAVSMDRRFYFLSRKEPDLFPLWDTGKLENL